MHFAEAGREDQLMPAFDALTKQGVGALIVAPDPFFDMVASARHNGGRAAMAGPLPSTGIYGRGGLMSYGVNFGDVIGPWDLCRKILKGQAPADLPVQRVDKSQFDPNLADERAA